MAEKSVVDLVEEWQTGAFLILGSALAGGVLAVASGASGTTALLVFGGGAVLAFLVLSYLLYGR
jgi:hypothetical protein